MGAWVLLLLNLVSWMFWWSSVWDQGYELRPGHLSPLLTLKRSGGDDTF